MLNGSLKESRLVVQEDLLEAVMPGKNSQCRVGRSQIEFLEDFQGHRPQAEIGMQERHLRYKR